MFIYMVDSPLPDSHGGRAENALQLIPFQDLWESGVRQRSGMFHGTITHMQPMVLVYKNDEKPTF